MAVKPCSVVLNRKEVEAYFTRKRKTSDEAVVLKDSHKELKLMTSNSTDVPPFTRNSMSHTSVKPVLSDADIPKTSDVMSIRHQESKNLKSSEQSKLNSTTVQKPNNNVTKKCLPELSIIGKTRSCTSNEDPTFREFSSELDQEGKVKPVCDKISVVSFKDLAGVKLSNYSKKSDFVVIAIHASSKSVNTSGVIGMDFVMYTAMQIMDHNARVLRKEVEKNTLKLYADLSLSPGLIRCQVCCKIFNSSKKLFEHIRNFHCLTYQCITCRGYPVHLLDLASHLCNEHGVQCFPGTFCNATNELLVHGSESSFIFTCLICNICTSNTSMKKLIEHVPSQHHLCKMCGSSFLVAADLLLHTAGHPGAADTFTCFECHASFRCYKHFQNHFNEKACNNISKNHILTRKLFIKDNVSPTSTNFYQCPYCNVQMNNDIHFSINHITCHKAKMCSLCNQSYITMSVSDVGSIEDICESCIVTENAFFNTSIKQLKINYTEFNRQNKRPLVIADTINITVNWTECDTEIIQICISKIISNLKEMDRIPEANPVFHFCKYCAQNINVAKDLYSHLNKSHKITFELDGIPNETLTLESLRDLLLNDYNAVDLKMDALICCIGKIIDLEVQGACCCLYCNKILPKSDLFNHVASKHPTCRTCCQLFNTTQELEMHVKEHAKGAVKLFRCLRCYKQAKSLKSFINHFHDNHLDLEGRKSVDIVERLNIEHNTKVKFACPYCPVATDSDLCYSKHLSFHYMEYCGECSEKYVFDSSNPKCVIPHDCSVLNKNITSSRYEYLKNIVCQHIQPKGTKLNKIEQACKIEIVIKSKTPLTNMDLKCKILSMCAQPQIPMLNKNYAHSCTKSQLEKSTSQHSIDNSLQLRTSSTTYIEQLFLPSKSIFSLELPACLYCSLIFISPSEFVAHVSDVHHVCRICNANFQSFNKLSDHHTLHIKGLIHFYTCKICNMELKSHKAMENHCNMENHEFVNIDNCKSSPKYLYSSSKKPYKCPYCPLDFQLEQNLNKHVKCHKIVSCDTCKKTFVPSIIEILADSVTSKTCYLCLENWNNEAVFTDSLNCSLSPTTKFQNNKVLIAETTGIDFCEPFEYVTVKEEACLKKSEDDILVAADNDSNKISTCESFPLIAGEKDVLKFESVDTSNYTNRLHFSGSTVTIAKNPVLPKLDSQQESLENVEIKMEAIDCSDEEIDKNAESVDFKRASYEECDNGFIFQTKLDIKDELDFS